MIKARDEKIILETTSLDFENKAVLNPACIKVNDITHMFYRAVNKNNISSIGYCKLRDNKVVERSKKPILFPEYEYEKNGVEDPRVTYLDGVYYIFYTAYDGRNAHIAYATSTDLINFTKKGLISPNITYDEAIEIFYNKNLGERYFIQKLYLEKEIKKSDLLWEKDALLFPKKINNKYALLHRIRPDIQVIYFNEFSDLTDDYWRDYLRDLEEYTILKPKYEFEKEYIGGGCPPIETEYGWLIIYHAVEEVSTLGKVYSAGAALLDINNPLVEIGRLEKPLFSPDSFWEKNGVVNNVVYPTGAIINGDTISIYYGAADKLIAMKAFSLKELLSKLKKVS